MLFHVSTMTSYATACQLSVHTHQRSLTPHHSIKNCQTHSGLSISRRRDQSHTNRTQSCHAASSQQPEQRDKKLPYGTDTKRTYEATDNRAAGTGLVALSLWLYRGKAQLAPMVMHRTQQLYIPGCLAVFSVLCIAFFYCKNRTVDFWCKQQRRLSYVDIIPVLTNDVATIKQDVAQVKDDIKQMLSQPWYKRL